MLLDNKALPRSSLQRSFLPEYKSLVTRGLQRIKTLSFLFVSLEHQRCFGFIISGNTRVVNVSEMHVLLKGLVFHMWNSGKQDLELERGVIKLVCWKDLSPYFSPLTVFSSHPSSCQSFRIETC